MKYPIDIDKNFNFVYLKIYADVGIAIHEYVQRTYKFKEIKKEMYSNNYKVKGEADAVDSPYLFEFKTTETTKIKDRYKYDHYVQANIYAYILNTEYNYDLKTITLVYFFRDNLKKDPLTFDINIDNKLAIEYLNRSNIILGSIENKTLPDKIGSNKEKCNYCIYKEYCKKDDKRKKSPSSFAL